MTITSAKVRVNGATIALLECGPQDGETILLLHGIPANAELWRDVMGLLAAAGYRVLAPNMPGYGQTRLPNGADYSLSAVGELYAAWLQQAQMRDVWLVGHDVGGAVAQFLAVRHPQYFAYLTMGDTVVADSFPVLPISVLKALSRVGLYSLLAPLIPALFGSAMRHAFSNPRKMDSETMKRVFWDSKISSAEGRREFARHLAALTNRGSIQIVPQLRDVHIPTLLLWAREDAYQTWDVVGQTLRDFLPTGTPLVVADGVGHFFPLEKPEIYVKRMLKWRREL